MSYRMRAHTYCLKLANDGFGDARKIEFEADTPEAALRMTQQLCGSRPVQLFEDGRKLAELKLSKHSGFWIVTN